MDATPIYGALTVAATIAGNLWGKLKTAVKAEEAIADQPRLREEFEAHKAEDLTHHAATQQSLTKMNGELRRIGDNIDWIRRELDRENR